MPKPYEHNDKFSRRAQFQGYRARSVFKLKELDEKFQLVKPGMNVLDIGAAPGSWLQYLAEAVGEHGLIVGVDIQPIQPVSKNVILIQGDITDQSIVEQIQSAFERRTADLVVSDIAPSTTGIAGVDHARSIELSEMVVQAADQLLRLKGSLVMKVFHGEKFAVFFKSLQRKYGYVTALKVKASRDRSREMYIVCQRKK